MQPVPVEEVAGAAGVARHRCREAQPVAFALYRCALDRGDQSLSPAAEADDRRFYHIRPPPPALTLRRVLSRDRTLPRRLGNSCMPVRSGTLAISNLESTRHR